MNTARPKVIILQHRLLHYRIRLFEYLKQLLERSDIDLELVHGQASNLDRLRKDEGVLGWTTKVNNNFFSIAGRELIWQPINDLSRDADLVIVMQENRMLSNYPLLIKRRFGGPKVAYWGHGKNYQSTAPGGLREKWKSLMLNQVDWWFAYTDMTTEHVSAHGYPVSQITTLNNAIDVSGFQSELASITEEEQSEARLALGLAATDRIGLFCGSLYPEKRVDLLLGGIDLIRSRIPDFHMLVIGDGPSAGEVRQAAESRPWLHCLGVKKGRDKAVLFKLAHVQLNPGLVGLHVLDAFSAGLPMVTTATALHSPEIAYLEHGVNGVVSESDDIAGYAEPIIELLLDKTRWQAMSQQCLADASRYTVENMAENFSSGILRCLEYYGIRNKQ